MSLLKFGACYLAAVNLIAFCLCGYDKFCACTDRWRVKERTLLLWCALGGSPAFLAGMLLFRHKIRKPKFYLGVPLLLLLWAAGCWFLFFGKGVLL